MNLKNKILLSLVAVLLVSNVATIYYVYYGKNHRTLQVEDSINKDNSLPIKSDQTATSSELAVSGILTGKALISSSSTTLIEDFTAGEVSADWLDKPVKVAVDKNLFQYAKLGPNDSPRTFSDSAYLLGRIKDGRLAGKNIYLFSLSYSDVESAGPAWGVPENFRMVDDDGHFIILLNYSDENRLDLNFWPETSGRFLYNKQIKISNLIPEKKILIPGTETFIIADDYCGINADLALNQDFSSSTLAFKYNNQPVYFNDNIDSGCYHVVANDGTLCTYHLDSKLTNGIDPKKIKITWNSGAINNSSYSHPRVAACSGNLRCFKYVPEVNADKLSGVGRLDSGEKLYELRVNDNSVTKEIYNAYYPGYDQKKIPYDEFLKLHPVIYWQDPLGRFIELRNDLFSPAVECGKPVIYLYPEKETDISVQVAPAGGFTITEPAYNDGWFVKADTQGNLYNYTDKQQYPYLFWEGYALNYQRPNEGFVVQKEKVGEFLSKTLLRLGLNAKEAAEFMDFWVPKMTTEPYYLISFVPQSEFDKLAPLNVSPRPDTVIRVFMDYQGLPKPIKLASPKIITPVRSGFTVVEWGGALQR